MDNKTLWETALAEFELALSQPIFQTWFTRTRILKKEKGIVEIGCPNTHTKERLETRHYRLIKSALDRVTKEDNELTFTIDAQTPALKTPIGPLFETPKTPGTPSKEGDPKNAHGLFEQYTFNNFIIGPNNNLAYAVAQAIVATPGKVYNPLFLYSGVGLGKTHLIQAIGNEIIKKHPALKVIYCTGEAFTNELLEEIQRARQKRGTASRFRNKFRKVDVLIIDDVQFIAGRETTQEEFFHTFNALYMAKKQIVLASDKPPSEISKLAPRLSSRFSSGMTADMQPPDVDVRNAILRRKRTEFALEISNEVIDFIAQAVSSNVRDLEGAFTQVITFAQTQNLAPSLELAQKVLGKTKVTATPRVRSREIIKVIATYFDVTQQELKGPRRLKGIVVPRQIAMYLLRSYTDTPLAGIGEILGGRDHTTVMHGVEKIENQLARSPKVQQDLRNLKAMLRV
ncbi:chromosomal replication initiator protein DnaA [Candidatus Parcubacteria bacterium]|nr:chromosomal replication initiator protein DnaA [Candidatus Parcubacteria bacterium]